MLKKAIVWEAKPAPKKRRKKRLSAAIERPEKPSAADLLAAIPESPWLN